MYLPGHLAMGYLVAAGPALATRRALDVRYAVVPALIGAVSPDFIDKPLNYFDIVSTSRTAGHSIFTILLLIALWHWLKRAKKAIARPYGWWLVGIGTHLFIDLVNDVFRGFEARGHLFTTWITWPLTDANTAQIQFDIGKHIRLHPSFTSLEISVFALTLVVAIASRFYGAKPGGVDGV